MPVQVDIVHQSPYSGESGYGGMVTICGRQMTMVCRAPYASPSGYSASVTILWGKWLWWVGHHMWETDDYGVSGTICLCISWYGASVTIL